MQNENIFTGKKKKKPKQNQQNLTKSQNLTIKTAEKSLSLLAHYQWQISKHQELLKFPAVTAEKHMRPAED